MIHVVKTGLSLCIFAAVSFLCASSLQAESTERRDVSAAKVPLQLSEAIDRSGVTRKPVVRPAGKGVDYDWGKDHIFIKLSTAEIGGVLTLIQDNLKAGFYLGMHLHRKHTEIFYILEGEIEFRTDKESFLAAAGTVVYLPAGTPHAAKSSTGGRMLMFYAPGGFDNMLAEIENASWIDRINPIARARRDRKYDSIKLSNDIAPDPKAPDAIFVSRGAGPSAELATGVKVTKLSLAQTNGLAAVAEETLKADAVRKLLASRGYDEVVYVLEGQLDITVAGVPQRLEAGATLYLPADHRVGIRSVTGARLLSCVMRGAS